jgi:hypothetical protein
MQERETEYRGYKIEAQPNGDDWLLAVSPTRPELPIMRRHSFRASVSSLEDAVSQAQRRIDLLMDIDWMLP